jgi:zinc/manganese transport system substrate-binding protein
MYSTCLKALALALTALPALAGPLMAKELKVVASFSIIGDLARNVGGQRIELSTLVGPDSDAHVYEPRPKDAMTLAAADVILANGLQFEGFLARLIAASGTEAAVVELTDGAALLKDPEGGHWHHYADRSVFHEGLHDPHAWQSIPNVKVYVANIADAFCAADSEGCDIYRTNAGAYADELEALDREIRETLDAVPQERRTAIVGHAAFRYFENEYGVRFLAPSGVSTESEASAADIAGIVDRIRADEAAAIFIENISDPRLMQRIAEETGLAIAGTLYSDALSDESGPAPTYLAMMRHNARTIGNALGAGE